jgi:hypothetical protein
MQRVFIGYGKNDRQHHFSAKLHGGPVWLHAALGDIRAIGTLPRPLNQNICKRPDARLLTHWVKVEKPTLITITQHPILSYRIAQKFHQRPYQEGYCNTMDAPITVGQILLCCYQC